eukprot:g13153.t1
MEMIRPPARKGFASAVATFEEGAGEVASAAEARPNEEGEKEAEKTAETKPKPRRRRLLRDRPAPITLTDRAAAQLISLVASKPGKVGVRLGVKRRGCNGMSYTLKYADEKPKGDEEVVVQAVPPAAATAAAAAAASASSARQQGASGGADGGSSSGGGATAAAAAAASSTTAAAAVGGGSDVRLFVDPMATLYIAGTVMDWEETELSSEFTFTNPNAKGECGCGESFNV